MTTVPTAALPGWLAEQVALIDATLRVVTDREAPAPELPYAILEGYAPGFGWDPGLRQRARAGLCGVQATGVGRTELDASAMLDKLRDAIVAVPRQVGPDDARVGRWESEGPPTSLGGAGSLVNVAERYTAHVEAASP